MRISPLLPYLKILSTHTHTELKKLERRKEMAITVPRIKLGSQGFEVSKQGLGCMGLTFNHGSPKPEEEMIKLIHHAINTGVTFLDTSDIYGPHTNELLVGKTKPREK
ncbi:unnamed protein product [Ilex paraguariensis]|uniref:NADP-dependent oxidoreductase domain-containing protein n=2 Tax=Ilex paraguariensis TaxID=185542 RepID=A0ABC8TH28_9AQUA